MTCSPADAILLLLLPGAALAQLRIRQSPAQLWVRPGRTAELNCSTDSGWNASRHRAVNWYREQPGSRLQFIYQSSNSPRSDGKYSGMRRAEGLFSLHISSAQKEDSGFYYCASTTHPSEFGDGTRLVVTDATEPTLSILLPVDADLREPPLAAIPLLCHLYDVPEGWDAVGWQHSNGSLVTAASMDERGVLSAWSLAWLTAERWGGAVGCTATQSSTGRSISVTISPPSSTAQCLQWLPAVLLPSVLTITARLMLQLCKKPHVGGPGAPQPPQQRRPPLPPHRAAGRSQEAEYAAVALRSPSPPLQ
ncbi:tyrosine-protein kinase receptor TYRO3-like [Lagopus muta]|uniref:tyrosine-protein kinase receptor TYRO3-like n=1 Tax=Lagopus muta TaxID=64668 RepID=UPI00209CAB1F|nr:tyrosine-protein kinase receptor TYRO3-like [Lagopus muta]